MRRRNTIAASGTPTARSANVPGSGAAANYAYKVAYRGVRATDEGGNSPEQSVAAGG